MTEIPCPKEIMILEDSDNFVRWRIPCFCNDQRHDWTYEVEYDKELNDVVMYVYGNGYTNNSAFHYNWFIDKWRDWTNRFRLILRILFFGYAEYGMDLGFVGHQAIYNHVKVLVLAAKKVRESGRDYGTLDERMMNENT